MRPFKNYLIVALKGIAMGAADVVPGVSGGTIAFITGIYDRLIHALKSINFRTLALLFRGKFREFAQQTDFIFLISLLVGILLSVFSLARLMSHLLVSYPTLTWSFFFGLIVASVFVVSKEVGRWNVATITALVAGIVISYLITVVSPASTPDAWWFVIICGALTICAMILPGISGAFILLLMGKYAYLMDAVANLKMGIILLFASGAVVGLLAFSRLLSFMLNKWRYQTIALLTGFMLGSLNKVWPWKNTLEWYTDSHGVTHPLTEKSVLPGSYAEIYSVDPQTVPALLMAILGIVTILSIELWVKRKGTH